MTRQSSRITVDLGDWNRRKLLENIARGRGLTLQELMLLALREWLERQAEDLNTVIGVKPEPGRSIEELLAELDKVSTLKPALTARQLLGSGLIGLWKDRTDIKDSAKYARQLREEAQRRH